MNLKTRPCIAMVNKDVPESGLVEGEIVEYQYELFANDTYVVRTEDERNVLVSSKYIILIARL